jgi:hypothetical protein
MPISMMQLSFISLLKFCITSNSSAPKSTRDCKEHIKLCLGGDWDQREERAAPINREERKTQADDTPTPFEQLEG